MRVTFCFDLRFDTFIKTGNSLFFKKKCQIRSKLLQQKAQTLNPILQATAHYAHRVCEKLRIQNKLAREIVVSIQTSPFTDKRYYRSMTVKLPYPTDDTRLITRYAKDGIRHLYREGYEYSKTGVGLVDLVERTYAQDDLFSERQPAQSTKLMEAVDAINKRFGRGTACPAAEGVTRQWTNKRQMLSPCYTTRWEHLPKVRC